MYGVKDLYDMLEVLAIDASNRALAIKKAERSD